MRSHNERERGGREKERKKKLHVISLANEMYMCKHIYMWVHYNMKREEKG